VLVKTGPVRRRLLRTAAATVDRAVVAAIQLSNARVRARAEALPHAERIEKLAAVRAMYGAEELLSDRDAFFPRPPAVRPHVREVRKLEWGGECVEASWESAFEAHESSVRERYRSHVANRTAHARVYGARAGSRRPAVIVVHGYLSGQWAVEERAWPIRWLNTRGGLDVAVTVLPFHGVRGRAGGGAPPFPGADPRFTNEGFRQAVADLRVLIALLKERGAPRVGIMGMSLGGYTTALMATLEPDLAFAAPLIPLASVADFARDQGRMGRGAQMLEQHAALEAANLVVSPFARPSLVPPERVLVVGAEADRITPVAHAERIAAHLGVPLTRVSGGHLLQVWRRDAFRALRAMLQKNGIA
jgi:pimeloyl-ACP methyl ester carboxylesterase